MGNIFKLQTETILVIMCFILGTLPPALGATTTHDNFTVYIIPPITDNKTLPNSLIPSSYISDTVYIKASPGEFEPASIVIRADKNISSLIVESTNLTGSNGTIQSTNVDIRVVKCWYQGGEGRWDNYVKGRYLTPELLLKDDSLVKVNNENWSSKTNPDGKNYLKLINGSYIDISNNTPQNPDLVVIPISQRNVMDANNLQPISLKKGYNKQFWITLYVPNNTKAGNYAGYIYLKSCNTTIKKLKLNLQVLPINLPDPRLEYSIYYRGIITDQGSISSEDKTVKQFTAELKDLASHGVSNPSIYPASSDDMLLQIISSRNQTGMNNSNLYYLVGLSAANSIPYYENITSPYGVNNVYIYGPDEANMNSSDYRSKIENVHNNGGRVFNAQSKSNADQVADILDLSIVSGSPNSTLANKYHSYGHKIYSYANPQTYPELPRLFRINYGLLLWQKDYDGAMDYAYQHSFGDIWNDFDNNAWRDHVFAYPTANGVIDTVQWEGFREGVDDVRYLTALQNSMVRAKAQGKDTTEAENYLANLKGSDLQYRDLDLVRSQIVNYTIELQN